MTENNGFLERDQSQVGAGQWATIQKTEWQPLTNDSWKLPTFEQLIVSGTRAALVFAVSAPVAGLLSKDVFVGLGVGLFAGIGYGLWDYQHNITTLFDVYRERMTRQEVYERETKAAASATNERVVLESYETQNGRNVRTIYDQLSTTREVLERVAMLESLSVRELQNVGLSFDASKALMTELTKSGFVVREQPNKPAQWSAKGKSLVHYFSTQPALVCEDN